jgi:site-specific DNA-methyltransferase (adenine-specific)
LPIIKEKIGARTPNFLEDAEFEFITQNNIPKDWKIRIEALPYYFKDPVKFDRKIDPKKLQFGSKIDLSQTKKEKYYSVKRIISPEVVVLNTGIKVKLIGVKTKEEKTEEAINFLISKLKGQKVFLKFDTTKHDKDGNLLVYLYLKNKTFINAHLIKNGLADVDINMDFRYKNKFINLKE